jgi:hypothetical protein
LYVGWGELSGAYADVPTIVDQYMEKLFSNAYWMLVQGEKAMRLTSPPNKDYPYKMIPLVRHHYTETSKSFTVQNITHLFDNELLVTRQFMYGPKYGEHLRILISWKIYAMVNIPYLCLEG